MWQIKENGREKGVLLCGVGRSLQKLSVLWRLRRMFTHTWAEEGDLRAPHATREAKSQCTSPSQTPISVTSAIVPLVKEDPLISKPRV